VRRSPPSRLLPLLLAAGLAVTGLVGAGCEPRTTVSDPADGPATAPDAAPDAETRDDAPAATPDAEAPADAPTVPPLHPSVDGYPETVVTIERAGTGPLTLAVKLAATPEHRRHGLMEVPELPDGTGMLFTFDDDRTGGFWMKDTLVPLDIAFVDGEGEIVAILAMDPCEEDPCEVYDPGVTYRAALEVSQGWFAAEGIEVGDELSFPAPGPS
jgi:uncharacterized protein